jgi:hypothetical protein
LVTDAHFTAGWLYDLVSYELYKAFGGASLVLLKAALAASIAVLLLRLCRLPGHTWWIAAFCTLLAVLAVGVRLLLQPATFSDFWFVLALSLLPKAEAARDGLIRSVLRCWPLALVFVIWANTDDWFVLGLGAVGLLWLGQLFDAVHRGESSLSALSARLSLQWLILVAACLLNPVHVHAFTVPSELTWLPYLTYLENRGVSPAGLAYIPLLGLGALSFIANHSRWRWQWFLPWLSLALLSTIYARAVPFFAILAGPVLAWNLQEWTAPRLGSDRGRNSPWRGMFMIGRALTVIACIVLVVCAWPGWLQPDQPFEPRRWTVEPSGTLESGAAATRRWLTEGKLGQGRGLHLSPETASAFAWFCPESNGLSDKNLASAIREERQDAVDYRARMRELGINHVFLYDSDHGRFLESLKQFLENPREWPLLYVEGYLAVFGWRDPAAVGGADSFVDWQWDANELAFHPTADKKAPPQPTVRAPEPREWYEAFWKRAPARPADQDEATLHLMHARVLQGLAPARHKSAWQISQAVALIGAGSSWSWPSGILDARLRLPRLHPISPGPDFVPASMSGSDLLAYTLQMQLQVQFVRQRDDTPPALLYLAIRAARRAVAANPDDAQAYLVLGECYVSLLEHTRERAWADRLPQIMQLRQSQASSAFNTAVRLQPNLAEAHLNLVRLYAQMECMDLMLDHYQKYRKLMQTKRQPADPDADLVAFEEQQFARISKEVERRELAYEVAAYGVPASGRAFVAYKHQLLGKARDLLLDSHLAAFGPRGMAMELELLLRTGQADKVWEWTSPEHRPELGPSYYWLRIAALGAIGEYELAREELKEFAASLAGGPLGQPVAFRETIALLVAKRILDESSAKESPPTLLLQTFERNDFISQVAGLAKNLTQEANLLVLGGLLALEEGDIERAESAFGEALTYWKDEASAATGGGLDFAGRVIAQECLEMLR